MQPAIINIFIHLAAKKAGRILLEILEKLKICLRPKSIGDFVTNATDIQVEKSILEKLKILLPRIFLYYRRNWENYGVENTIVNRSH